MLRYYIAVHYSFETFSKRTSAPRAQIDRCSGFGWHGSFENNSTAPIQRLHQKEPRYTSQISFLWSNSSWAPDLLPPSQWLLTVESITIRPKNYMHQVTSRSVSQTLIDHPSWNGFHKKKANKETLSGFSTTASSQLDQESLPFRKKELNSANIVRRGKKMMNIWP